MEASSTHTSDFWPSAITTMARGAVPRGVVPLLFVGFEAGYGFLVPNGDAFDGFFAHRRRSEQGGLEQAVDVFLRDGFVGECADAAAVFQQFKHDCLLANGEKLFVIVAQRKP